MKTVRLNKQMADLGLCSRREADEYIARGWVYVDEAPVTLLGTKVSPTQKIRLAAPATRQQAARVSIVLNKPIGVVSCQAERGYPAAITLIMAKNRAPTDQGVRFFPAHRNGLAPAGRLDIDSTGLLLLTQDGRIAKQVIGENSLVEKEYLVRVSGNLSPEGLRLLNHGLCLDGVRLKPAQVMWKNADQLGFILREGKKRQIRRMCALVGLDVLALKRVRIGAIQLGNLALGQWRYLRCDERL